MTGERHSPSFATINRPPGHLLTKQDEKSESLAGRFEFQFGPNPSRDPDSDEELEDEFEAYLGNPITAEPELTSEEEVVDRLLVL